MAAGQERILRRRIRSIQSTKKITRAMELIAGSRIVRAQARVHAAAPYADQITQVVRDLAAAGGRRRAARYLVPRPEIRKVAHVVIAADRGLCGGYNSTVIRAAEGSMREHKLRSGATTSSSSWAARSRATSATATTASTSSHTGFSDQPSYEDARAIAAAVEAPFLAGDIDLVELVYTRFVSAGSQEVVVRPLMPLDAETFQAANRPTASPPTTSSSRRPAEILEALLPRYAEARVYAALLNAAASEHAARQRAMKSATDNAEDLITQPHPGHEPRPPGRDHHRDHGDRRRRRGAPLGRRDAHVVE